MLDPASRWTPDQVRSLLGRVVEMAAQYLGELNHPDTPVTHNLSPDDVRAQFPVVLDGLPHSYAQLLEDAAKYMELNVRTGHPRFFNQLWGGFSMPAFLGEFFTALARTSMYTFEMAPVASLLEVELMRKMSGYLGWPDGEGTFATGGSNANLIALLAARNRLFPETKRKGLLQAGGQLVFFVSEEAHYSFQKAANVMGLGTESLVRVATDDLGRMRPDALEQAIRTAKAAGQQPFCVAATAGTTVLGAYDPVDLLAPIAQAHGLWLHVDGSWGGSAALSPRLNHLLAGVQHADSMAWNPHKQMSLGLPCSVILFRQRGTLRHSHSSTHNSYIYREHEYDSYDLGDISLQCGRAVDSLRLWMSWRFFGDEGFARRVERLHTLAQYAAERIEQHPHFCLQAPVQSANVCFRWEQPGLDANAFNAELRAELLRRGQAMINVAHLKNGDFTIRWVFTNPEIDNAEIDRTLVLLEEAAQAVLAGTAA